MPVRNFIVQLNNSRECCANILSEVLWHSKPTIELMGDAQGKGTSIEQLYPFGKSGFQIKFPQSIKIGLSRQEIKKLESIKSLSDLQRHALKVWIYSFYLAGIRVSDVLFTRWSMIYDDRLHYRMGKNSKFLSLKIPEKLLDIILTYKQNKQGLDDFIFPEMKKADFKNPKDVYNKIKVANSKFNIHLKTIAKRAGIEKS